MAMEQESLQEYLDKQQGVSQPDFTVDSDSKAEWALRKLSEIRKQSKAICNEAMDQQNLIEQWKNERLNRLEKDTEFFQTLLTSYAFTKKQDDPKFKSLKLPHGKIGFRKQQQEWKFSDKAIDELKHSGYADLIRVREEPDKAAIKKRFPVVKGGHPLDMETGELISSITVEEREDKPIVEVND